MHDVIYLLIRLFNHVLFHVISPKIVIFANSRSQSISGLGQGISDILYTIYTISALLALPHAVPLLNIFDENYKYISITS